MAKKQQQTKTTKHTIEFSNNTPVQQATLPLYSTWTETSILDPDSFGRGRGLLLRAYSLNLGTQTHQVLDE